MIADAEAVIGAYLRQHSALSALVGNRVAVKLPRKFDVPWVKVTQLGAGDRSFQSDHLVSHLLQFDCYSGKDGGSVEADLIGRTVRAALRELDPADLDGWTSSVVMLNGPRNLGEDLDYEPARDRTLVEAEILLHPDAGGS